MGAAEAIAGAYPRAGSALAREIVAVAGRIGANPYDLANLINFESAGQFSSSVRNKLSGATGLIQFMPSTARSLGTSTEALAQLTPVQQMSWVERYFGPYKGRVANGPDLYMAVFYPVAMGKGLDWEFPANVQAWNPGIRTVGDYVAFVNRNARLSGSVGAQQATAIARQSQSVGQKVALTGLSIRSRLLRAPTWAMGVAGGLAGLFAFVLLRAVFSRHP